LSLSTMLRASLVESCEDILICLTGVVSGNAYCFAAIAKVLSCTPLHSPAILFTSYVELKQRRSCDNHCTNQHLIIQKQLRHATLIYK
jgi:hypothetical protein